MDTMFSLLGVLGAACAVGMYAAVSVDRISAEKPVFYIVNGIGALLVLLAASRRFDLGDLGTIGQELIWMLVSITGAARAFAKKSDPQPQIQPDAAPVVPRAALGVKQVVHGRGYSSGAIS